MVTFIGARSGQTLSCFDGTAQQPIQSVYAAAIIIAALNVLLYIQKRGREIYSFQEIAVGNTAKTEGGTILWKQCRYLSGDPERQGTSTNGRIKIGNA
jgi:hypothetical protein